MKALLIHRTLHLLMALFAMGMPLRLIAQNNPDEAPVPDNKPVVRNVQPMRILMPAVAVNQDRGDWLESWVFAGMSKAKARLRLENDASTRMALLEERCSLTDAQIAKIELAKRGDIARFFQKFDSLRLEINDRQPTRENMAELSKLISPLQQQWNSGLNGPDSLFVAILSTTLNEDQKEAMRLEAKRQFDERSRYHAMSLIKMIEHSIPLTEKQRQTLLEVLMEGAYKGKVDQHLEQYISIQAATKLSDERLGSFLDKNQLKTFRELQKHWEANVPFLEQMVKQPPKQGKEMWMDVLQ